MVDKFLRVGDCWLSDRFVGGYDNEVNDFYVEDRYVGHKYFTSEGNYHMALVTLLNDRQGFINYIMGYIDDKIKETTNEYDRVCKLGGGTSTIISDLELLQELKEEITKYDEIWE